MADITDMSNQYKQMTVDTEDVNILLLGETGVGKSTFINAFANYMEYDQFKIAEANTVRCLIPSSFTVTTENMQEQLVKIGRDKNENEEVGESSTQGARSYVFPLAKCGSKRVRLIDTPGVGDTRGVDRDTMNFENILSYVANMEYLHAICFFLKPNNSKLTAYFEYCIKQLLSRLEKSASKNIIFLFTNSRSTFYRPGDTAPALKKILTQIENKPPHVNIAFLKENVFCLDNEAFRFLVCYKQGIQFSEEDIDSFSRSWDHSVAECWRMINYITGGGNGTQKLIPHKVQDTISVNNARQLIIQLSKPMADIAELINDNINLLQRHNITLKKENMSMENLRKRLYVPVVNLRHKELDKPTTVCTNADCCDIYMVGGKKKYHYKQRCHDPCYLQTVPVEMIGSPELVNCAAINHSTKLCNECSCDFSAHMHIYYLTETYEDKITDAGVQSQIKDSQSALKEAAKLIETITSRKHDYEMEKEIIVKNMAKFAHFLQQNAIAPYNDAYRAYIIYLIDKENSYGSDTDTQVVMYFQDLLKRYDEEKLVLDNALQMKSDASSLSVVTTKDIFEAAKNLFTLKHTGQQIQDLVDKQSKTRKAEYNNNTEYVLDTVQDRNINPSIKGVTKTESPKKNKLKKGDNISPDMKDKFNELFQNFPEMEEFLAQKHKRNSQQSDDKQYKTENFHAENNQKRGAYNKKFANNPQQKHWEGQQNTYGNTNYKNPNMHQQINHQNRGTHFSNARRGQRGYRRGSGQGHNDYNRDQHLNNQLPTGCNPAVYNHIPNSVHPKSYNQEPDQFNQAQGSFNYNQGPNNGNQRPLNYNRAPPNHNQGPPNYNQGPPNFNQGPPNFNQGPPNYNQGPSNYNQGPPNYNQRRPNYNLNVPNANQASQNFYQDSPNQEMGSNQYQNSNSSQQGQHFPNQGQGFANQGQNVQRPTQKSNQNTGPNNQKFQEDTFNSGYAQNTDETTGEHASRKSRPSGPYKPNQVEKNFNTPAKSQDDREALEDEDPEEEADYKSFMKRHGLLDSSDKDSVYVKNNAGGNHSRRSRGARHNRGSRGGKRNNRTKSLDKLAWDSESDSGQSYSSKSTTKSDFNKYNPQADDYVYVNDTNSNYERNQYHNIGHDQRHDQFVNQNQTEQRNQHQAGQRNEYQRLTEEKKGVLNFFKGIFD